MKTIRALILVTAVFCPVGQAIADEGDLPHVRCDGRRLMFGWHGGAPHKVDVSNLIRSASLASASVVSASRSGDIDYFLVSVSGPSRAVAIGESNIAGTESNLLWLKLKSWKLLDSQSMPFRSSRDSLEPVGDIHLKSGVITVRYANRRESTEYLLRYDSGQPEEKISVLRAGDVE